MRCPYTFGHKVVCNTTRVTLEERKKFKDVQVYIMLAVCVSVLRLFNNVFTAGQMFWHVSFSLVHTHIHAHTPKSQSNAVCELKQQVSQFHRPSANYVCVEM